MKPLLWGNYLDKYTRIHIYIHTYARIFVHYIMYVWRQWYGMNCSRRQSSVDRGLRNKGMLTMTLSVLVLELKESWQLTIAHYLFVAVELPDSFVVAENANVTFWWDYVSHCWFSYYYYCCRCSCCRSCYYC